MKRIVSILIIVMIGYHAKTQEITGTFEYKRTVYNQLKYVLSVPKDSLNAPLIIFLHGSGERGADTSKLYVHGPLHYNRENPINAYILAPQCPENEYWDIPTLQQLLKTILKNNPIDTQRIYLTGLSMGGWGAFNWAVEYPNQFAALVPIAGFVDRIPMMDACAMKNIAIKIVHGAKDDVVNPIYSQMIFDKLSQCNPDITLTILPDANHNSWTVIYEDKAFYKWLLSKRLKY